MDGLTVGRKVHYVTGTGAHLAAEVVKVWSGGTVNLTVFNPHDGNHGDELIWAKTSVTYSEEPLPYTWHWIEKV